MLDLRTQTRPGTGDLSWFRNPASTHQVHHHVLVEGVPPIGRHLADVHHGLGVVGVDVEDGGVDHARHVGGVGGGARHAGVRGEADLTEAGTRDGGTSGR